MGTWLATTLKALHDGLPSLHDMFTGHTWCPTHPAWQHLVDQLWPSGTQSGMPKRFPEIDHIRASIADHWLKWCIANVLPGVVHCCANVRTSSIETLMEVTDSGAKLPDYEPFMDSTVFEDLTRCCHTTGVQEVVLSNDTDTPEEPVHFASALAWHLKCCWDIDSQRSVSDAMEKAERLFRILSVAKKAASDFHLEWKHLLQFMGDFISAFVNDEMVKRAEAFTAGMKDCCQLVHGFNMESILAPDSGTDIDWTKAKDVLASEDSSKLHESVPPLRQTATQFYKLHAWVVALQPVLAACASGDSVQKTLQTAATTKASCDAIATESGQRLGRGLGNLTALQVLLRPTDVASTIAPKIASRLKRSAATVATECRTQWSLADVQHIAMMTGDAKLIDKLTEAAGQKGE